MQAEQLERINAELNYKIRIFSGKHRRRGKANAGDKRKGSKWALVLEKQTRIQGQIEQGLHLQNLYKQEAMKSEQRKTNRVPA